MPKVTRQELSEAVSAHLGCSHTQARAMVDTVFQAMVTSLGQGNRIEVRGFGSWMVRHRKANPNGRNPSTGEKVALPARRVVSFKAGRLLREALRRVQ